MNRPSPRKTAVKHANGSLSRAKTESEDDENDADSASDVPAVPQPPDALSEMMAGLQGASTSRISVYRITKNQPPSYVFECDPTSFSLDDLRDKYNGGEFRLYIMKDGRLWKNMRVVVEPKQVIHSHDPAPPTQNPTSEILAIMRDGFAAQAAAIREMSASRNGAASLFQGADLPAIITAAAAAITALRPPPPPPPADTSAQALDMFMRGLELAREMRDDAPGDSSFGGMLRDVLRSPIVAAAVQNSMSPPPPPEPRPAPPAPQISQAKTTPTPPPSSQPSAENNMIAYYLGFLVSKAQADADPELYAEMVLDNLTDEQLIPMLNRGPALIDDFIAAVPAVANHRPWFESLIAAVTNALKVDDTSDAEKDDNASDAATTVVPQQSA
jgi:hypothetical protein